MGNKIRVHSEKEMGILRQFDEARSKFMEEHEIADLSALADYILESEKNEKEVLAIGQGIPGYPEIIQTDLAVFQSHIAKRGLEADTAGKIRNTTEKLN